MGSCPSGRDCRIAGRLRAVSEMGLLSATSSRVVKKATPSLESVAPPPRISAERLTFGSAFSSRPALRETLRYPSDSPELIRTSSMRMLRWGKVMPTTVLS